MNRLHNKKALVIGGSTGIGREVCRLFAQEGADVAVGDHGREKAGASLIAELANSGRDVLQCDVDVRSEEQVKAVIDLAIARFGHLDILVNNAGMSQVGTEDLGRPFAELSPEEWQAGIDQNLNLTANVTRAALVDITQAVGGRIVFVTSVTGPVVTAPVSQASPMTLANSGSVEPYTVSPRIGNSEA